MNIGGGEAADQMVRMMLTGTEVTVRLGASALKNLLAITLALAKHHKTLSGKVNMGKMLRETRDKSAGYWVGCSADFFINRTALNGTFLEGQMCRHFKITRGN